jgi:hypothetical protein
MPVLRRNCNDGPSVTDWRVMLPAVYGLSKPWRAAARNASRPQECAAGSGRPALEIGPSFCLPFFHRSVSEDCGALAGLRGFELAEGDC